MKVRAVAITKPLVEGVDTAEDFIAYAARVSNPSNQMNKETSSKLIKYCVDNRHWSVFEQVGLTLEIETTRDIGRQILRHRSFSFQEFSQRYADPTSMGYELREARLQDTKNRQNSIDTNNEDLLIAWDIKQAWLAEKALEIYKWAQDNGIAKEQCRVVLPEGLTTTKMYMTGNMRSWIHYCGLRMKNGTQKEHMQVAIACWEEILKHFPSFSSL